MPTITPQDFITYLRKLSPDELPGFKAQSRLMPQKSQQHHFPTPSEESRHAAVLCLLIPSENELEIVLTVRSESLNSHKGQISFPGGRMEENESYEETALRETYEEIGVSPENIQIIGRLSGLMMAHTNVFVQPVIGVSDVRKFEINPDEVAEVFTVPLRRLLTDKHFNMSDETIRGVEMEIPQWDIHPTVPLWGATAMMLSELVELYHRFSG